MQPAVQQPSLIDDLLGFGSNSNEQKVEVKQQQISTGGGIMDDLFDFSNNNNINVNTSSLTGYESYDFKLVCDSSKGQGMKLSMAYCYKNGPMMIIKCENYSSNVITRLDLKLNKNYLGIQPVSALQLKGVVNQNATQYCEVPLQLSIDPVQSNTLDTAVQIAIRSTRENVNAPVVSMFVTHIPPLIFFCVCPMDRMVFLNAWKSISDQQSHSEKLGSVKNRSQAEVQKMFVEHQCSFIADRQIPGKGVSLYFATKLGNIDVFLEVSLAVSGAARVVAKSSNNYYAFVVVKAAVNLLGT